MTMKHVKVTKDVHEKLLHLKSKSNAKSINDVIIELIKISEEFYINKGTLNVANKDFIVKCDNGKIVEIQIK